MTEPRLESIRISGFRSLADVELSELPDVTVLIGENASGKSNLIRFFEMLQWMTGPRNLNSFVAKHGGANDQLFGGSAETPVMHAEIGIRTKGGLNEYGFSLAFAAPDTFSFLDERFRFTRAGFPTVADWEQLEGGHKEAMIVEAAQPTSQLPVNQRTASTVLFLLRNVVTFQFHDTSNTSPFKTNWDIHENRYLRANGGNVAPILYRFRNEDFQRYRDICDTIQQVIPGFDGFDISEQHGKVYLKWQDRWSERPFGAHVTSDGSLRLFALVTLLNLPSEMQPNVIVLDEPELGLHPKAIRMIGELIHSVSKERQIILATQSPLLIDQFGASEVFVTTIFEGRTTFERFDRDHYQVWKEWLYVEPD